MRDKDAFILLYAMLAVTILLILCGIIDQENNIQSLKTSTLKEMPLKGTGNRVCICRNQQEFIEGNYE
jgi:hypothetical protein